MNCARHPIDEALTTPANYLYAIEQLQQKLIKRGRLFNLEYHGINFQQLYYKRHSLAKQLALQWKKNHHQAQPVFCHIIQQKGKQRQVYRFDTLELLTQQVVCRIIKQHLDPSLSPAVYSHRTGLNHFKAARAFSNHLRKEQGLYIIQTDICSYSDSINVLPDAPLWSLLSSWLQQISSQPLSKAAQQFLTHSLRPIILTNQGHSYQNIVGLTQGTPLCTLVANYYLRSVDHVLAKLPGLFYLRYGDDLLLAHQNANALTHAEKTLHQALSQLQLQTHPEKTHKLHLAKHPIALHSLIVDYPPRTQLHYLGFNIQNTANIQANKYLVRGFMRDLRQRILQSHWLIQSLPLEDRAKQLCHLVNQCLNPKSTLCNGRLKLILHHTDERHLLKALDYQIALLLAECLSQQKGVRAFRRISYKDLRHRWNLHSLVVCKNQQQYMG